MKKKNLKELKKVCRPKKNQITKTVLKLHKLYYVFGRRKLWSLGVKTKT